MIVDINNYAHGNRKRGELKIPRLDVLLGTAFLSMVEHQHLFEDGIILAMDVPTEIESLVVRSVAGKHLKTIALGDGLTIYELIKKHGAGEQVKCLRNLANTAGRNGLGQIRAMGRAAALDLTQSEEFRRNMIEDVIPTLTLMSGATMPRIIVNIYQGMCGGAGSAGGCVVCDALLSIILECTDAKVECRIHLLSSATFASRDFQRTNENAAAAAVDWARRASNPCDDRISFTVYAHELYPVGTDKILRDSLLLQQIQGLQAAKVRTHLDRIEPNRSISGPFGNFRFISSNHFLALTPEQIAGDIARAWWPIVTQIASTPPDVGLVEGFRWDMQVERRPQEIVPGICNRVLMSSEQELIDSLTSPPSAWKAMPVVTLIDGREFSLTNIKAVFASPVGEVKQLTERFRLLKTNKIVVDEECEKVEAPLRDLEYKQETLVRQARKRIIAIQNRSVWSRLESNKKKNKLGKASFESLRKNSNQLWKLRAEHIAISSARSQIEEVLANLEAKFSSLSQILKTAFPQGESHKQKPSVTPLPIDSFLPDLLSLAEAKQSSRDEIVHLLAQGVEFVTPDGLHRITGAADCSLDAIVRATETGPFYLEGPGWGGAATSQVQEEIFLVYPPVSSDLAKDLGKIHEQFGNSDRLAFSKSAFGSVNIILLRIGYGKELGDLFNRPYRRALRQALRSHLAALYLDNATEALSELGLDKDGNVVSGDVSNDTV